MPIEAELKARVRKPEDVMARLEAAFGPGRAEVYQDTYYDLPAGALTATDQELRIRTVHDATGTSSRTVLTYTGARVDEASGSKPENETEVENADAAHAIFRGLGHMPTISFEKPCRNYEFQLDGRDSLATLVQVPQLQGAFIELESQVEQEHLADALSAVRAVLATLGISESDLTTEQYTDAVAATR